MKTKLIPIIALLSIAWLYPACSKDTCEQKTEYDNILQKYKDMIPYKGGEKLTFLHVNTGDTVVFEGDPNWKTYYNEKFYGNECQTKVKVEGRGMEFFSDALNEGILINQYITQQSDHAFIIVYKDLNIGTLLLGSNKFKVFDSILIQNKYYSNIYFYPSSDTNSSQNKIGCYYTYTDGIIKLVSKTGQTWDLIDKK